MSSGYPNSLDNFPTNKTDGLDAGDETPGSSNVGDHALHHNNLADAVNKIEAALGTTPGTPFSTVKDRIAALQADFEAKRSFTVTVTANNSGWAGDYQCDGTADEVQINLAIGDLPSTGGTVLLSDGDFFLAAAIAINKPNVTIRGQGARATVLRRTADVMMVQAIGAATNNRIVRPQIKELCIDGGDGSEYARVQPGLKMKFASKGHCQNVHFRAITCEATRMVETWDCYFTNCFWEDCGGNNGARPAVNILNLESPDSETETSNNCFFTDCHWESFRDGAVTIQGAGIRSNKHRFVNCKFESRKNRGDFIVIDNACDVRFVNVNVAIGEQDTGYNTDVDGIVVTDTFGFSIDGGYFHQVGTDQTIRTFISMGAGCYASHIDKIVMESGSSNKPSVAAIEFTGGAAVRVGHIEWGWNPGNTTTFSGAPVAAQMPDVVPTVAGAVTDASFPTLGSSPTTNLVPPSGAGPVVDTTNNRVYFKVGSTWRFAALT